MNLYPYLLPHPAIFASKVVGHQSLRPWVQSKAEEEGKLKQLQEQHNDVVQKLEQHLREDAEGRLEQQRQMLEAASSAARAQLRMQLEETHREALQTANEAHAKAMQVVCGARHKLCDVRMYNPCTYVVQCRWFINAQTFPDHTLRPLESSL